MPITYRVTALCKAASIAFLTTTTVSLAADGPLRIVGIVAAFISTAFITQLTAMVRASSTTTNRYPGIDTNSRLDVAAWHVAALTTPFRETVVSGWAAFVWNIGARHFMTS
jgi:hypothetical protein